LVRLTNFGSMTEVWPTGTLCIIQGLQSEAGQLLNGLLAEVRGIDEKTGRVCLRLNRRDKKEQWKKLKAENLCLSPLAPGMFVKVTNGRKNVKRARVECLANDGEVCVELDLSGQLHAFSPTSLHPLRDDELVQCSAPKEIVVHAAALAQDLHITSEAARGLLRVFTDLDRRVGQVTPAESEFDIQDSSLNDFSIFRTVLKDVPAAPAINEALAEQQWSTVLGIASSDAGAGAAIGCLIGLTIGDAVGAPLEFTTVKSFEPSSFGLPSAEDSRWPHLKVDSKLVYESECNKFRLQPGQWTDDASMALCLADSILVHRGYHGGDARVRWHMWWTHGYCNAFRFDGDRKATSSVGLGGNIGSSLDNLEETPTRTRPDELPPVYDSMTEDAGNGSIMRLAPVAIAFNRTPLVAEYVGDLQSRATHPGREAGWCCRFVAFVICEAITSHREAKGSRPGDDAGEFLEVAIDKFLTRHPIVDGDPSLVRLHALLKCAPPSSMEQNWNWQLPCHPVEAAARARRSSPDRCYNGYPVDENYWGGYCMDGLAAALWGLWHGMSFDSTLQLVANLGGDADTTAAIACQLAGAIYGLEGILEGDLGREGVQNLRRWDPYCEVGLRAALLYAVPPREPPKCMQ